MLSLYNQFPVFDILDAIHYINDHDKSVTRRSRDLIDDSGIKIEMPGVKATDLDITIEGRTLKVTGKSRHGKEFSYSYVLKSGVDDASITSTLQDGLLEITLPKKKEVTARKIPIST